MYRTELIRGHLIWLALTMFAAVIIAAGASAYIIYQTSLEVTAQLLLEKARNNARILEAAARHDAHSAFGGDGALDAIMAAHEHFYIGATGEFTLARREGGQIVFLLRNRQAGMDVPEPVPIADTTLSEPMRRALAGESGTLVGRDYRGVWVMAAFEPVRRLGYGIVAKIDMEEIYAPYIKAGLAILVVAVVVGCGAFVVFHRLGEQISRKFADSAGQFHRLAVNARDMIFRIRLPEGRFEYVNPAVEALLGERQETFYNAPGGLYERLHPENRDAYVRQWRDLLMGEVPPRSELRVVTRAGEEKWLEVRSVR